MGKIRLTDGTTFVVSSSGLWKDSQTGCTTFTIEEFTSLILQVKTFVYPYLQYMQAIKAEVYTCDDLETIKRMVIDYDSVIVPVVDIPVE